MLKKVKIFKRLFVSIIKRLLRTMGYEIISDTSKTLTMVGGLQRAANLGIKINTVIDVGASNGRWSEICMVSYPSAKYLLIEGQNEYVNQLNVFKDKYVNSDYVIAVASDSIGTIYFDSSEVGTGIASHEKVDEHFFPSFATSIDYEINTRKLPPPYLIKLDTHGFEVPILNGSLETLSQTNLIVMECYNFTLNNSCLRFHEMISFMETKGFRCIDIVDIGVRQKDGLLWQMDIFFARADRPEFLNQKYV